MFHRASAFIIDYLLVLLVIQIIATLAFSVTAGRVQSMGPLQIWSCRWPPELPVSFPYGTIDVSAAEREVQQSVCTHGLPSMPHAHVLQVTASQKTGRWTINQTDRIALDTQGRAVWILWLGAFAIPLLWIYRTLFESRTGQTLGKHWLGLRVSSRQHQLPSWKQSAVRNLWLLLPLLLADMVMEGPMLLLPNLLLLTPAFGWLMFATGVICTIWYAPAAVSTARNIEPLHDRIAGTYVDRIM